MVEGASVAVADIRAYGHAGDAHGTYAAYRSAILQTASADYEPEQLAAWAGVEVADLSQWDARRLAAHTFVAVVDERVAGFADFRAAEGLLDMLFVHPDFGRRGIAQQLVCTVKQEALRAGLVALRTHASRTARPALERSGFRVIRSRPDNVIRGQTLPNYEMRWDLPTGSP